MEVSTGTGKQLRCLDLLAALVEAVNGHRQYCTPGHRGGKAYDVFMNALLADAEQGLSTTAPPQVLMEFVSALKAVGAYDISVSVDGLGSVFERKQASPLGRTQAQIADLYGVKRAFIMPNGTTQANVVAISAAAKPGSTILIQRNSHSSVYAAIIQLGLQPVYLDPEHLPDHDVLTCVTPQRLAAALHNHPETSTVFLTSPNYFGMVGDLPQLIEIAHAHGAVVIVDAAHGAYYNFYPHAPMPWAAERLGADIVTQSTHKTIGALSQGSLLLVNNERLIEPLYEVIDGLGYMSTSFSHPLMLSVGAAICQMDFHGQALIAQALDMSESMRVQIQRIPGLQCFGQELLTIDPSVCALDPLRLTVNCRAWGISGYQLEQHLMERGIYPELATLDNVLFLMTPFDEMADGQAIVDVLRDLQPLVGGAGRLARLSTPPPKREQIYTPREAFYHPHKRSMPWQFAVGKVSCETVAAYPPGIPVIVMGENVTQATIDYFYAVRTQGGRLKGLANVEREEIKVIDV